MASHQFSESHPVARSRMEGAWRIVAGGVVGNARLTAMTGLVLLVLLAIEGVTVLRVRALIVPHVFVGLMLIPPIGLKLASTGYRFMRYYTGSIRYRAAGPPRPLPRVIAPVLVLCTLALFGSGVLLLLLGPQGGGTWRSVHTLAFFIWFWVMTVHVLTYVWRIPGLVRTDLSPRGSSAALPGALTRHSLVVGSVVLGLVVAIAFLPWDASWVHWLSQRQFGE